VRVREVVGVQFCEECGSMMKTDGEAMVCTACGARADPAGEFVSTEAQEDEGVIETSEDVDFEGQPRATDVTCDECGHGEAYYALIQTASADEAPTRFYKCLDCGHRWRGYN
jgi:DNA-directed RNA polymerase subunit M